MSDSNDQKLTAPAGTPVPDLIEQYRLRRDAWIAQADELARLRDEVRGSAEREAMEIVTAARRDVRQIVMDARRELLVLSAQVQAALGEAGAPPDPAALLNRGRDTDDVLTPDASDFTESIFAPEEAVKGMLEEARADMDALVEDARTVPYQALPEPTVVKPAAERPAITVEPLSAARPQHTPPSFSSFSSLSSPPSSASSPLSSLSSPLSSLSAPLSALSSSASRMLLSSPFPSDAVPVPQRRVRTFITLFGIAGVAVLLGTIWWVRSGDDAPAVDPATQASAAPAASVPAPGAPPAAASAPVTAPVAAASEAAAPRSKLSLLVEARRSAWLRTSVDGQSDIGRMITVGEKFRINADRAVTMRVGDAGAVLVSVNNGEAVPLGRDGQVVTRQFVVEEGESDTGAPRPQPPAPAGPPSAGPPASAPPLSAPIASGPPANAPVGPVPVPLVQPVSAAPPAPEPAPPAPARVETAPPASAPRAELPTPGPSTPASAVIAASRQWLDAYQRQDRTVMASLSIEGLQLADERRNEERFPANVGVNRSLDRVSVQIAADTAVLTAVMTERSADNGVPPRVSPISQVWVLSGNQWRVRQVRLVSEARLNQIFR